MTAEVLKRALWSIMLDVNNVARLRESFSEVRGMSDSEAAGWAAERLYSDELLAEVNGRLEFVRACALVADGRNTDEMTTRYERCLGRGVEAMPKVWPKRAAFVGGRIGRDFPKLTGCDGELRASSSPACFVDEDGAVICVVEFENEFAFDGVPGASSFRVVYRRVVADGDPVAFSLSGLEEFFPEEFFGFWSGSGGAF